MNELAIMTLAMLQCKRKNDNNPYWAKKRVEFHDEGDLCQNKFFISAGVTTFGSHFLALNVYVFATKKNPFSRF